MGVEPTKTVLRPSLVLKTSQHTGTDSLPHAGFTGVLKFCKTEQKPNCHPDHSTIQYSVHDLICFSGSGVVHAFQHVGVHL